MGCILSIYLSIYDYIWTRKNALLETIDYSTSPYNLLLEGKIIDAKNYYWSGEWKKHPEWDFVGVTTLFTFYWDITINTINTAKLLVKPEGRIMVGGVLASIQPEEVEKATGIKPHIGGVAELPAKNLSKSLNFHKLRLFYIHKI